MPEIEFDKLVAQLDTPKPGASDIGSMLDQANELMKKVDTLLAVLDKRGFTEIIRKYVIKEFDLANVPELSAPKVIYQDVPVGVQPLSDTHKQMYEELNKIKEADLKVLLEKMKDGKKDSSSGTNTSN